jgi:hypothetical protein
MSTDGTSVDSPVWGAPATSAPRWGLRETLTAVGVAAVIAGLGGAAIYAATDGDSRAFGGAHQAFGPGGTPGGPQGPRGGPGGGPGPAAPEDTSLHGEFVVRNGIDGAGGYTTMVTQTGSVTAISPTSISVRSDDGFNGTYVIPPTATGATPPFHTGDSVVVRATRSGQTMTVTTIGAPRGGAPHRN